MNGVRRFLGNASTPTSTPPVSKDRTSISSRSPSPTKELPPPPPPQATKGLFIRKDRKPPPSVSGPSSTASSPTTSQSTPLPRRKAPPPSEWEETSTLSSQSHHQASGGEKPANTRDALLLSLLSSEAMVDSRGYEILNAEEVEELEKEHTVLSSRVGALQKKLATETKIRDAAQTLARLNSSTSSPSRISRQSSNALENAERKAEVAQTELWRVKERATNIHRRLLEHRAGVLGAALAETERVTRAQESRAADANGLHRPLSSPAHKFDGAHLFAGHEDTVVPGRHSRGPSQKELEELEARLAAAEEHAQEQEAELENAQTAAAAELEDVRAAAAEELANARAASASELVRARERAGELEGRVATLERELESSARGREDAGGLEVRIRTLERELLDAERKADRARTEAEAAAAAWAVEKASWASERQLFEKEKGRWVGLSETLENERERWELEREELNAQAKDQIALAAEGLRGLVQRFDVPLFSRESGLAVLVDALGRYLEKHNAQESEQLLTAEVEKRNAMTRELDAAKAEIRALQTHSSGSSIHMEPRPSSPFAFAKDAAGFVAILQPLWATLPSPEARAARLSSAARPFRAGGGRTSPSLRMGVGPGSPGPSISDLDVRTLKTLYTPGGSGSGPGAGADRSASPASPTTTGSIDGGGGAGPGVFSVEAFAQRVQALISDDRALMERLIRFAQAHDLLKKNAERAQKLAQESNAALETYQRQVRTLEEHLARADGWEGNVEQLSAEKLALEQRAAEQAETLRELTSANAALSARALQLAQEAAAAQEEVRAISSVSEREQGQRLALLEEINLVQTENGSLRQQLRALGKL